MKLEFWYDPIMPETMLKLEGNWMERNDIYGFLYMVQSLPLQNWLYPAGSWPGLQAHLESLSRGDRTELTFFGRKVDYEDLEKALSGMRELTLSFEPWDTKEIREERLGEMSELIKKMELKTSPFPEHAGIPADPPSDDGEFWLRSIRNEEDFYLACRAGSDCCRVEECFLDSFGKLEELKKLTVSLKRPADGIICVFETEKQRREFAGYAAMFKGCDYRFVLQSDSTWEKSLKQKYGEPLRLRRNLYWFQEIFTRLKKTFEGKSLLEMERESIEIRHDRKADEFSEDPDWKYCRAKQGWLDRKKFIWKIMSES
ncbi:MAG: hypothetical protein LUE14_13335 [Clostridiales bacterium]|nr:hypothetical protein [Clostridiales bacterium]